MGDDSAGTFGSDIGASRAGGSFVNPPRLLLQGNTTRKRTHSQRSASPAPSDGNFTSGPAQILRVQRQFPRPPAPRPLNPPINRPDPNQEDQFFAPLAGWPLFELYHERFYSGAVSVNDNIYAHRGFLIECAKHK